jgi:signal transduction histidine kinase
MNEGHGLASLRTRAKELGGELQITSNDGRGTTILLSVPLSGKVIHRDGRVRQNAGQFSSPSIQTGNSEILLV